MQNPEEITKDDILKLKACGVFTALFLSIGLLLWAAGADHFFLGVAFCAWIGSLSVVMKD